MRVLALFTLAMWSTAVSITAFILLPLATLAYAPKLAALLDRVLEDIWYWELAGHAVMLCFWWGAFSLIQATLKFIPSKQKVQQ